MRSAYALENMSCNATAPPLVPAAFRWKEHDVTASVTQERHVTAPPAKVLLLATKEAVHRTTQSRLVRMMGTDKHTEHFS